MTRHALHAVGPREIAAEVTMVRVDDAGTHEDPVVGIVVLDPVTGAAFTADYSDIYVTSAAGDGAGRTFSARLTLATTPPRGMHAAPMVDLEQVAQLAL